ncbi:hypothetical protein BDZ94DRAFT_1200641 [Collybia nuda]|uniref:HMG box domain-containing protein n=1 Tax=Collybia nuda TaxID=64659 RepID=A0A9P6CE30_9AGAR|nr:hypothetical protein BDZ94DRAFT_1200641 [Collybia nuda]
MPSYRSELPSRRSRRLSNQEPKNYAELEDQWQHVELLYPGPETIVRRPTLSVSPATPSALLFPSSLPDKSHLVPSHTRRRQKGHIARPPNAFMLFRSIFWANEKLKEEPIERDHRDISRIAAHCWNALDDAAKDPYRELALQKKLQHGLEHPDYKYKPAFSRLRSSKRRIKRNSDEEERCRKLASLIMDGASSAGIREAMKGTEKQPPLRRNSSRSGATRARRCASKANSPHLSSIKLGSPGLKVESPLRPPSYLSGYQENSFVPTDEIPHLELSPVKKEEEAFTIQFDPSIQLPLHRDLDSHFGIKPILSGPATNFCFWNTEDDMVIEDKADLVGPISHEPTYQFYGSVKFTNPFTDGPRDPSHPGPTSGHGPFNTYSTMATITNNISTQVCDTNMNDYFNFD